MTEVSPKKKHLEEYTANFLHEIIAKFIAQKSEVINFLKREPEEPQRGREEDRKVVIIKIIELEKIFEELSPFIRKIREKSSEVLSQNKITASYFIFGKIHQSWKAIFLLARQGFFYEVMELLRSIKESSDLAMLFMIGNDENPDLKKWFEGEIIDNKKSRAMIDSYVNASSENNLPIEKMKNYVYRGLSKYSHTSYVVLLDLFDVFNHDFDFEQNSSFHHMRESGLPAIIDELWSTVFTLNFFYQTVGDSESFSKLGEILERSFWRGADDVDNAEKIKQTIERFS